MSRRVRSVIRRKSNNHIIENVMIPTRDGVSLSTDIHRPQTDGNLVEEPLPVLLQRTPYNKSAPVRLEEATFFTNSGYVTVMQDCRGRYDSEGGFSKYVDEGQDGYDTVEWLAQQPWCNGKVGTFGLSYASHTQAALACLNPPHLSAMWLECGGFASAYHSGCRNGGAFELRQVTWAFREAMESPEARENPDTTRAAMARQDIHDWFSRFPWKPGHSPLSWTPDYEDYLMEIWGNDSFDEYWQQVGLSALAHLGPFSDVPQVHQCSWYDPYAHGTIRNYVELSQTKTAPISLIMGPWTHGGRSLTYSGDVDFGPHSTLDNPSEGSFNKQRLAFFDHWLKGQENNWRKKAPVKLFVMGGGSGRRNPEGRLDHGGRWTEEDTWPPAKVQETSFYFHRGGGLSISLPETEARSSSYLFDPARPVPTIGGNISSGLPIMEPGGFDQRESEDFYGCSAPFLPLATRPDVLVFQTEPLGESLEVTGPVVVNLWISSSAVDTDFTAKLIDVYPPSRNYPEGYSLNLTDGILRTKFRNSWSEPELMQPGQVYPLTIELYPTSNLFAEGHRIRLDVSSSNFPRLDVNGNTGENPCLSPIKVVANNTVYHDRDRPSHVVLWVAAESTA
ncbi:MAG: CocE/NonD family hydrolase [Chloroflexi bacterium]|nr:CocE/NonD family hydrolase [Chloroflexota bacterium]